MVRAARRKIPRTMSTQHPDNASLPSWVSGDVIQGDAEIEEALFAYRELGCMEVMWDSEGKDVDTHVVRKLLSKYGEFFRERVLGEDVFLTYRVPNPRVEVTERKILLETLASIPVAHDVASAFYRRDVSPIFEVILPFTTSGNELLWLLRYYEKTIAGAGKVRLNDSLIVEDWIGPFKPGTIEVIPLLEDMESIVRTCDILGSYLEAVKPKYIRVFIARSDPALNYGLVCAVLLCKLALSQLRGLREKSGVEVYPIVGVGTMPFRGHLTPGNLERFMEEYPGVCTVTIQSALKYDYPLEDVRRLVATLNECLPCGEPPAMEPHEVGLLKSILAKFKAEYQRVVERLAPLVNAVAAHVPQRRARKLHIGLFGYSRSVEGVSLPRAIPFAAAFYSLGVPPELIGMKALSSLSDAEWEILDKYYVNLEHDLEVAAAFVSLRNLSMLADVCGEIASIAGANREELRLGIADLTRDLETVEEELSIKLGPRSLTQRKYENMVNDFLIAFLEQDSQGAKKYLVEAAKIRKCLG